MKIPKLCDWIHNISFLGSNQKQITNSFLYLLHFSISTFCTITFKLQFDSDKTPPTPHLLKWTLSCEFMLLPLLFPFTYFNFYSHNDKRSVIHGFRSSNTSAEPVQSCYFTFMINVKFAVMTQIPTLRRRKS